MVTVVHSWRSFAKAQRLVLTTLQLVRGEREQNVQHFWSQEMLIGGHCGRMDLRVRADSMLRYSLNLYTVDRTTSNY